MIASAFPIEGAWRTATYVVAGRSTGIDGVLLFADGEWSTLYFVPGPTDVGPWAIAEAGRYELDGERLTFHHRLLFQGGGGRQLDMDQHAARVEPCRIRLEDRTLAIHFPSGNSLVCERMSA